MLSYLSNAISEEPKSFQVRVGSSKRSIVGIFRAVLPTMRCIPRLWCNSFKRQQISFLPTRCSGNWMTVTSGTCAQGKKTVSSQTAGSPVNRNGAAASVSSIAVGGRPAPEHNFTRVRSPAPGRFDFPFRLWNFSRVRREADVRAELGRRRMRSPSLLPLSLLDE